MSLMAGPQSKEQWKSRFFDRKGAYRQCAVNPLSACLAHIAVFDPTTKTIFAFRMKALPFGSVKSVQSFLRVAHSLWAIRTNYFDDFVTFAKAGEVASVARSMKFVFKALGWLFGEDGDKALDFSHCVSALGVQIDVRNMHFGVVTIDNATARRGDLLQILDDVILSKKLGRIDALRLRGRLQFAAGQFAGRVARKSLNVVTKHVYSTCGADLDDPTVSALKFRRTFISSSAPRTLDASKSGTWFVFTDACFDHESFSGVGAVLVNSSGRLYQFFSQEICKELLDVINVTSRKTAIFELEFFAIFCSFQLWRNFLKGAQLVVYADNDGVRDSLISCQTSSVNGEPVLEACLKIEYECGMNLWMSRVPTDSSIADNLSRGHLEPLLSGGCCRQHVDVQLMWNALLDVARGGSLTSNAFPSEKGESLAASM